MIRSPARGARPAPVAWATRMSLTVSTSVALTSACLPGCGPADEGPPSAEVSQSGAAGEVDPARFAARVVSFSPGPGAGFGQDRMPGVVLGPPQGAGDAQGSLDVVSLGRGGEIVLALDRAVVDGPGADLVVFENPFYKSGDPQAVWSEFGEVAVSDDGVTWVSFPCDKAAPAATRCAGWRPVYASSASGVSPLDPAAGGDPFDLADVGVSRALFVRVRDLGSGPLAPPSTGFDLDAVVVLHAGDP